MKNIGSFKKSNILLLATPNMKGSWLEDFEGFTHVNTIPKIKVALDSSDFINKTFTYEGLPQINIYKNGKLLRKFHTEVPIDSLKPYIE